MKFFRFLSYIFILSIGLSQNIFPDPGNKKTEEQFIILYEELEELLEANIIDQQNSDNILNVLVELSSLLNSLENKDFTESIQKKLHELTVLNKEKFLNPKFISAEYTITLPTDYQSYFESGDIEYLNISKKLQKNISINSGYFIINYLNKFIYNLLESKNNNQSLTSFHKSIISSEIFYLLKSTAVDEKEAVIRHFSDLYSSIENTKPNLEFFKEAVLEAFTNFISVDTNKTLDKFIKEFRTDINPLNLSFVADMKVSLGMVSAKDIDAVFSIEDKIIKNQNNFTKDELLNFFKIINNFTSKPPSSLIKLYLQDKEQTFEQADIVALSKKIINSINFIFSNFIDNNKNIEFLIAGLDLEKSLVENDFMLIDSNIGTFTALTSTNKELQKVMTFKTSIIKAILLNFTVDKNNKININNLNMLSNLYVDQKFSQEFRTAILDLFNTLSEGNNILAEDEKTIFKKWVDDQSQKLAPGILYQTSNLNNYIETELDKALQENNEAEALRILEKINPTQQSFIINHTNPEPNGTSNLTFKYKLPLLVAYEKDFKNTIVKLIELGADPNIYDNEGTPFIQLILNKYKFNYRFLKSIIEKIQAKLVSNKKEKISISTMETIINATNVYGFNTIDFLSELSSEGAVMSKRALNILIFLKAHGWISPNKQDESTGMNAIHRAVLLEASQAFINELEKYVDAEAKDINGLKPIDYKVLKNWLRKRLERGTILPTERVEWKKLRNFPELTVYNPALIKSLTSLIYQVIKKDEQVDFNSYKAAVLKTEVKNKVAATEGIIVKNEHADFVKGLSVKYPDITEITLIDENIKKLSIDELLKLQTALKNREAPVTFANKTLFLEKISERLTEIKKIDFSSALTKFFEKALELSNVEEAKTLISNFYNQREIYNLDFSTIEDDNQDYFEKIEKLIEHLNKLGIKNLDSLELLESYIENICSFTNELFRISELRNMKASEVYNLTIKYTELIVPETFDEIINILTLDELEDLQRKLEKVKALKPFKHRNAFVKAIKERLDSIYEGLRTKPSLSEKAAANASVTEKVNNFRNPDEFYNFCKDQNLNLNDQELNLFLTKLTEKVAASFNIENFYLFLIQQNLFAKNSVGLNNQVIKILNVYYSIGTSGIKPRSSFVFSILKEMNFIGSSEDSKEVVKLLFAVLKENLKKSPNKPNKVMKEIDAFIQIVDKYKNLNSNVEVFVEIVNSVFNLSNIVLIDEVDYSYFGYKLKDFIGGSSIENLFKVLKGEFASIQERNAESYTYFSSFLLNIGHKVTNDLLLSMYGLIKQNQFSSKEKIESIIQKVDLAIEAFASKGLSKDILEFLKQVPLNTAYGPIFVNTFLNASLKTIDASNINDYFEIVKKLDAVEVKDKSDLAFGVKTTVYKISNDLKTNQKAMAQLQNSLGELKLLEAMNIFTKDFVPNKEQLKIINSKVKKIKNPILSFVDTFSWYAKALSVEKTSDGAAKSVLAKFIDLYTENKIAEESFVENLNNLLTGNSPYTQEELDKINKLVDAIPDNVVDKERTILLIREKQKVLIEVGMAGAGTTTGKAWNEKAKKDEDIRRGKEAAGSKKGIVDLSNERREELTTKNQKDIKKFK